MSGKRKGDKHGKGAHHKHGDPDLEKWAEEDKDTQHPGDFKGPLAEVDREAAEEAAERRRRHHAREREEERERAEDPELQHPGEFSGPLEEIDLDDDAAPDDDEDD